MDIYSCKSILKVRQRDIFVLVRHTEVLLVGIRGPVPKRLRCDTCRIRPIKKQHLLLSWERPESSTNGQRDLRWMIYGDHGRFLQRSVKVYRGLSVLTGETLGYQTSLLLTYSLIILLTLKYDKMQKGYFKSKRYPTYNDCIYIIYTVFIYT